MQLQLTEESLMIARRAFSLSLHSYIPRAANVSATSHKTSTNFITYSSRHYLSHILFTTLNFGNRLDSHSLSYFNGSMP